MPFNLIAREKLKGRLYFIPVLERTTEVDNRCLVAGAAAGDESNGAYMMDGKVSNGQTTSQMFAFD